MIIWIASYPKSGNTWVRAIISSFLNSNSNEIDINNLEIRQFPLVQDFKGLINDFKSEDQFIKNYIHAQEKINLDNQIKFLKHIMPIGNIIIMHLQMKLIHWVLYMS